METNTVKLTYHESDTVALVTLLTHTIDVEIVRDYNAALDHVLSTEGPRCLITTAAHPKIFCAGLNFEVFTRHSADVTNFISEYCRLLGRLLALPIPSIAAINGHALAGGFMLIMAHDIRIAVDKSIKYGMTEIKMGATIPKGMLAPLKAKLAPKPLIQINLLGDIIDNEKAVEWHIVDKIVDQKDILNASIKIASDLSALGETRIAYEGIKYAMWGEHIETANREGYDPYVEKSRKRLTEGMKTKL